MDYFVGLATQTLLVAAMAMSFNLLFGFGRLFSIAHAAFVGMGAYAVAVGGSLHGWPFWACLLVGVSVGGIVGLLVGAVALRVSDDYLAIATFALQFLFTAVLVNFRDFTAGAYGIPGVPAPALGGFAADTAPKQLAVAVCVIAIVLEACRRIIKSPFGLVLRASGESEQAARALGRKTRESKVLVFGVSGALAAFAGAFYAGYLGYILPDEFDVHFSILLLSIVVIGGAGSVWGPLPGALVMVALPDLLNLIGVTSSTLVYVREIFFGVLLLAVVLLLRRGLLRPWRPTFGDRLDVTADVPKPRRTVGAGKTMSCEELSKSFGGVTAVKGISAEVPARTVTGIVGPNGAGKTTLFDLLTGFVSPDRGHVRLDGASLDGLSPELRSRRGLVRSFQDLKLFGGLSVLENVMAAVPSHGHDGLVAALFRRRMVKRVNEEKAAKAASALRTVGLAAQWRAEAASLSYAEQKLLSLARVLASDADAVLLDEPTSGLDPQTLDQITRLVRELAVSGRAVCVVEHNTQVLQQMADHMLFLHLGEVIAAGSPEEIVADKRLAAIYFGVRPDQPREVARGGS